MYEFDETVVYQGVTYYIVDSLPNGYWVVTKENPKDSKAPIQMFIISNKSDE